MAAFLASSLAHVCWRYPILLQSVMDDVPYQHISLHYVHGIIRMVSNLIELGCIQHTAKEVAPILSAYDGYAFGFFNLMVAANCFITFERSDGVNTFPLLYTNTNASDVTRKLNKERKSNPFLKYHTIDKLYYC
eukprot:1079894_1